MFLSSATGSYGYPCLSWYSEKGGRFITRIPKRPKQILQNGGITNIYCIWYLLTPRPKSTLCWTHKDFFFLLLTGTMIHLGIRVHRMDTRRERGGRSLFWCTPLPSLPTTQSPWLTPHTTGWAAVGSLQPPGAPCGCFSPRRQNTSVFTASTGNSLHSLPLWGGWDWTLSRRFESQWRDATGIRMWVGGCFFESLSFLALSQAPGGGCSLRMLFLNVVFTSK